MGKYLMFAEHEGDNGQRERLMQLLDVSGSMGRTDWPPSRLCGAKEAAEALILAKAPSHPEDEVGIGSFSGDARLIHAPVALGKGTSSLISSLKTLHTDSSTNIAAGLTLSGNALFGNWLEYQPKMPGSVTGWLSRLLYDDSPSPMLPRTRNGFLNRIVLCTDGGHNDPASDPVEVARKLKEQGVIIDCIGIGGSPAEVEEDTLKAIASVGPDGKPRYAFIGDKQKLIRKFKDLANRIRPA